MTVLRKYNELRNKLTKKYKELNLLVKVKQSIKPWQYSTFLIQKKVTIVGPKNIIFYIYTYYFIFNYI